MKWLSDAISGLEIFHLHQHRKFCYNDIILKFGLRFDILKITGEI